MKFTAVIVDDEKLNVEYVAGLLERYCSDIEIVATATSIEAALMAVNRHKPRILFLDIEIHNKTGFDLLDLIDDKTMQVILISAYDTYTFRAFKYVILDYILKPVDIEHLAAAVKRAKANIEAQAALSPARNGTPLAAEIISVPHKDFTEIIQWKNIIHLNANGNYTEIYTCDHHKVVSSKLISEYESILPYGIFFRVHKGYMVNLNYALKYVKGRQGTLVMSNGTEIPISPAKKDELNRLLNL